MVDDTITLYSKMSYCL